MKYSSVQIAGLSHIEPPVRVTSKRLEADIAAGTAPFGLPAGWLEELTGIAERRTWGRAIQPSDAAAMAAEKALAAAGVDRSLVGSIVNCSVSRDYVEPATGAIVHSKLGLDPACRSVDVGNACVGFFSGIELIATQIEAGMIDVGLVTAGEAAYQMLANTIERINAAPGDRAVFDMLLANLTLGEGAAAMVLTRGTDGHRILGSDSRSSTEHYGLSVGEAAGLRVDHRGLLDHGLALGEVAFGDQFPRALDLPIDQIDVLIQHQVSKTHLREAWNRVGFLSRTRTHNTVEHFGNIGPVSIPFTLSKAVEVGVVEGGDLVQLGFYGSGITTGAVSIHW